MKLRIYKDWLFDREVMIVIAAASALANIEAITLVLGALLVRSFGHEFSHAAAVSVLGGKTSDICLGPGYSQHINFEASIRSLPWIYFAGVIFDTVLVVIVAFLLYSTTGTGFLPEWIFKLFALGILCLMVISHVVPKYSDFNNTLRSMGFCRVRT